MAHSRKIKTLLDNSKLNANLSLSNEFPDWLQDFKKKSLAMFLEHNIPTVADSEWEYTRIDSLLKLLFNRDSLNNSDSKKLSDEDMISDNDAICIHFHNGQYFISSDLPNHIKIFSKTDDKDIFRNLFKPDNDHQSSFLSNMNSLIFSDTLLIKTLQNQKVDTEIHIINHSHENSIIAPVICSSLKSFSSIPCSSNSGKCWYSGWIAAPPPPGGPPPPPPPGGPPPPPPPAGTSATPW